MANMKEIARLAGVSLGTVSHVLNNSARVREPMRQRVLKAVQDAGYQPSELARGLRRDKTDMIGMIIPDITNRSEERRVGKECRSRWSPYH